MLYYPVWPIYHVLLSRYLNRLLIMLYLAHFALPDVTSEPSNIKPRKTLLHDL